MSIRTSILLTALLATTTLISTNAYACACGCGMFDVGTSEMLPTHPGGLAWLEYDFMNQDKNWHNSSKSPAADNGDKDIKTNFFTAGAEYMFNRAWGIEAEIPIWKRHFTSTDNAGDIVKSNHTAFGDIRLKGIYSGFSADMSSGMTFGVKLPTGDYHLSGFDRDTEIGTGSTDLLLGAYQMGNLAGSFNWFVNGQLDQPVLITAGYRPGSEVNAGLGSYYNGWNIDDIKIAPVLQMIGSYRLHDRGINANLGNSGYERVLFSPGLEVTTGGFKVYGDVAAPIYQQVKGNQLTAGELFKLNVSHAF